MLKNLRYPSFLYILEGKTLFSQEKTFPQIFPDIVLNIMHVKCLSEKPGSQLVIALKAFSV